MSSSISPADYPQGNVVGMIASFIINQRDARLSGAIREHTCNLLLDLVGCTIAGLNDNAAVPLREGIKTTRPRGDVPIWFKSETSCPIGAAVANSAAGVALDLDDVDPASVSHWGAAAITTAMAFKGPWEKRLTAIAIGLVVGNYIGVAGVRKKYTNAGVIVPYVTVAVHAALHGTPQTEIEHALAVAGEWAPSQRFMSRRSDEPKPDLGLVKEGIPQGVAAGLDAVEYVRKGMTGSRNILDDLHHFDFEGLQLKMENVMATCFKAYAACRHIHAPLDALLGLLKQHSVIKPAAIERILVETNRFGFTLPNKAEPGNLAELVYSINYCLALLIVDGYEALCPVVVEDALGERDDVIAVAKKIEVVHDVEMIAADPDTGDTMARVTVVASGREFKSEVTAPRGGGPRPFSRADVEAKFRLATRYAASEAEKDQLLAAFDKAREGSPEDLEECLKTMVF